MKNLTLTSVKVPVRRSTSLKSYKTPPDTPRHKKTVRFADALGLDLESVCHIVDKENPPIIPPSAMKYLKNAILPVESTQFVIGTRYLATYFPQPSSLPDYMSRVHDNKVVLENCVVDDREMTVTGTVRVVNLAFHKRVAVRYTFNEWLTINEVAASYVHKSSDGPTDKFSFTIHVPSWVVTGNRVQFAVLYSVSGQSFWDNNYGCNYIIECRAQTMPGYVG
jgi:protein phosphatase 1 regulatory subunit 3A/B/C/D/E